MAAIVGVRGINQQFKGPAMLEQEWRRSLADGVTATPPRRRRSAL